MKRWGEEEQIGGNESVRNPELAIRHTSQALSAKVLVVDDEGPVCDLLALYLGWKGLTVKTARSPAEALDQVASMDFDLVILDWDLAGVEALDLLNFFKGTRPQTSVVIYTGQQVDENFLKVALNGRADGILRKLGSLDTLWKEVLGQLTKPRDLLAGSDREHGPRTRSGVRET